MAGDLISRSALLAEYEWLKSQVSKCSVAEIEEHMERIRRAPAVEAEPVVHAHWVYDPNGCDWGIGAYRCSRCDCKNGGLPCNEDAHVYSYANARRCPYCGAHMDEEVADGT